MLSVVKSLKKLILSGTHKKDIINRNAEQEALRRDILSLALTKYHRTRW